MMDVCLFACGSINFNHFFALPFGYPKQPLFSNKNTNACSLFYHKNTSRMLIQIMDKYNIADIIVADRITGTQENHGQQKKITTA
jgi:hypothetical protein